VVPEGKFIGIDVPVQSAENLETHKLIRYLYKDQIIVRSTTETPPESGKKETVYLPVSHCLTFMNAE
jgi:hypothetical protein